MKRYMAYITAPWGENVFENTELAADYSRKLYEVGLFPICPVLLLPIFLNDQIPSEHKDAIDMSRELLKRSRILVVCGGEVNEAMKNDIAIAQRLGITATTLDGILDVKGCELWTEALVVKKLSRL